MTDNIRSSGGANGKELGARRIIIYSVCLTVMTVFATFLQISGIEFFGSVPSFTLALICAIGFILGDKFGAIFGLVAGFFIDLLSGFGFSLIPIMYFLCGYLCGRLKGTFLSSNFPSFLLYGALAGVLREIFTFIYYGLNSENFELSGLFTKVIIPEYFAYIVCMIPAYFAVFGIYLLFRGKENRSKRIY